MSAEERLDLLSELVAISRWERVYGDFTSARGRVREINEQLDKGAAR